MQLSFPEIIREGGFHILLPENFAIFFIFEGSNSKSQTRNVSTTTAEVNLCHLLPNHSIVILSDMHSAALHAATAATAIHAINLGHEKREQKCK